MSDCMKPDQPGLWRDGNERTYVAYMESEALKVRDLDTGEILSEERVEQAAPFRQAEWMGIDLTMAEFSAMPDAAGCWCDANDILWLIISGDGIDGHIFRLKEKGREWECVPCFGITVKMLHEWGPWTCCDFEPKNDEAVRFDWCKPYIVNHGWNGGPEALSAHGSYTRHSLQTVEEVPWKPETDDSTPIHEGSRTVHLPSVQSFGRLERDKWLAVKTLEESAELVEASKQWLKALDPADPSGINAGFDDCAGLLAKHGMTGNTDAMRGLDAARTAWRDRMTVKRRQAMIDEIADVLQTLANLATAYDITDKELEQAMNDCRERNRRRGRL